MQRLMILLATCSISMSVSHEALGQSAGELDPTFGLEAGLTATTLSRPAGTSGLVALTDGGWVVSARVREPGGTESYIPILTRYGANGVPVTPFGTNGVASGAAKVVGGGAVPVLFDGVRLYQVLVDPPQIRVLAYTLQGRPDPGYGVDGIATIQAGAGIHPLLEAVLQNGRVLIAASGHDGISQADKQFLLARLTPSGQPDPLFGAGGRRYYQVHSNLHAQNIFTGVALQADGRIVAAGRVWASASPNYNMAVARFDSNGEPDASFGLGGFRTFNMLEADFGRDVVVQDDGKLVVAGTICAMVDPVTANDFCMLGAVRLMPDGKFDPAFGGGGRALHWLLPIDGQPAKQGQVYGTAVDPQGRVLVFGSTTGAPSSSFIARLTSEGSLDPAFGEGGLIRNVHGDATISFVTASQLLELPSGEPRLITVGTRGDGTNTWAIVIARHFYDDPATTAASK